MAGGSKHRDVRLMRRRDNARIQVVRHHQRHMHALSLQESKDGKRSGLSLTYIYKEPGGSQLGTYTAMTSSGTDLYDLTPNSIASIYLNMDPNPTSLRPQWTKEPSYTASLCSDMAR